MRIYEIIWFDCYSQENKVSLIEAYLRPHAYNILHQYYPRADIESIREYVKPEVLRDKRELKSD